MYLVSNIDTRFDARDKEYFGDLHKALNSLNFDGESSIHDFIRPSYSI